MRATREAGMSDETSATNLLLGEMKGSLAALKEDLERRDKQAEDRDREASASRRVLYREMEKTRSEVQDTRTRTEALEKIMKEEVRPMVRLVKDWKSRWIGGLAVLGVIGAALPLLVGAAKETIIEIGRAIFGR